MLEQSNELPRPASYLRFTACYSDWPFIDMTMPDDKNHGYEARIPADLKKRLRAWGTRSLTFDEDDPLFPTQEERAAFDREYIELYNELKELGIDAEISLWW